MPTYEYRCDACGNQFEKFQSITAAPIRKCPRCGKNKVRRLISTGAGLIFKGSGFYITDYRSDSYKEKAKSETGGNSKAADGEKTEGAKSEGAKTEAKAESKPAAKPTKTEPKATSDKAKK